MTRLAALYHYPLKSGRARPLIASPLSPSGLAFDRHWMVADRTGNFLTGREHPKLVLIEATATSDGLSLHAPGMPPLHVANTAFSGQQETAVWRTEFAARNGASHADAWLSEYLQLPTQLLWIGEQSPRRVKDEAGIPLAFADGYPLLIISQGSLDVLNGHIGRKLPMLRFRPNLVISGCEPHAEDNWQRIRIGELEIELVKPCTRCVFTTIDPNTALKDAEKQPLKALAQTRRAGNEVIFGMNALCRSSGQLQVGMDVEILA